jgi:hypothetical protein
MVPETTVRSFSPGSTRRRRPHGDHSNYFASGIYYFENVGTINISGQDISGGNHGAQTSSVGTPPCANDSDAGVMDGAGVEWILGGSSAITISSASGTSFELFARQPVSGMEGAAGVSIRSVPDAPDAPADYMPSSASNVFSIGGGSGTQVKVQGLVYAPNADVTLSATAAGARALRRRGGVGADTRPPGLYLARPDGMVSTATPRPPRSSSHPVDRFGSTQRRTTPPRSSNSRTMPTAQLSSTPG